jgi:phosphatidylglycerophosphate synthase
VVFSKTSAQMTAILDAIILADGPHARDRVAGLSLRERAVRVAGRAGATRVLVIDGPDDRARIAAWWDAGAKARLLVVRAHDQVVHTPLVAPLAAQRGSAIAVGPDQAYAGAFIADGDAAALSIDALARGSSDQDAAPAGAAKIVHGEIARAPVRNAAEKRAAARLLYRIVHKPQDNAITRYLYRPVSGPLTKLFLMTPITPNQISYIVGAMVAVGIWLTASASMNRVIAGTAICLAASYVDCCDGEVARLKLLSSKLGAWLDTIIDELSSIAYMIALGWHCHLYFGPSYLGELGFDPWLVATAIGAFVYALTIYCVYYNIIVVVGSANSQDYVGRFEVVPAGEPNTVRLRPAATKAIATDNLPPVIRFVATYLPYVVRRDFIAWGTLVLAIAHLTQVSFAIQVAGGTLSAVIVSIDHLRLVRQRRAIARAGQIIRRAS